MPDYIEYIIISLAVVSVIIIALIVLLIIRVQYLRQYFNSRKFKLTMKLEVDPVSHLDKFVFYIFNNNLNDARVTDIGIGYDQESITFHKELLKKQNLEEEDWLIIQTRDSVSLDIDVEKTYRLILERNKGIYRLKKVRIYVIDSSGFETRVKARDFVKTLKKMLKQDRKIIALGKRKLRMEKFKAFFDFKNRGKVTPEEVKDLEPEAFKQQKDLVEKEDKTIDTPKSEVKETPKVVPEVEIKDDLEKDKKPEQDEKKVEESGEEKVDETVDEPAEEKVELKDEKKDKE